MIILADFPELKAIAWSRGAEQIEDREALSLYEANWRHVDKNKLSRSELALIDRLVNDYGNGILHV